jgi:hypothetical protein
LGLHTGVVAVNCGVIGSDDSEETDTLRRMILKSIYTGILIVGKRKSLISEIFLSFKPALAVFFILFIIACVLSTNDELVSQGIKQQENPYTKAEITTKIIPSANNTFGYNILLYERSLVHQPNIPGLPGNEGFGTQERAQKVVDFVVKKIRKNEMPPMVSMEDLNTMVVLK